jgi:hypothetical protein
MGVSCRAGGDLGDLMVGRDLGGGAGRHGGSA